MLMLSSNNRILPVAVRSLFFAGPKATAGIFGENWLTVTNRHCMSAILCQQASKFFQLQISGATFYFDQKTESTLSTVQPED
jgi:hypothetical protein